MGFESNYGSTRIAAPNPSALNVLTGARYSALKPKSMREQKSPFRVLTESGPLVALTVGVAHLVGVAGPASAQFFNFGGWSQPQPQPRGGSGWFGGDVYAPFQPPVRRYQAPRRQPPRQILEDFSKAPPPEKRETVPERRILVLGDAMADWLAYGLEDAYAEQPEMGVIRKHKTVSGLIKYQRST